MTKESEMMKRFNLVDALNDELLNLYHNATPTYPNLDSDYEQDLFNSWFEDYARFEIEELEHDVKIGSLVKDYGPVYTYGRGGRTLAPSKLVVSRGTSFRMVQVDDLNISPLEARKLLKDIREFNRMVASWNKSIPEVWEESVAANGWQAEIDENAGKRRVMRRVYESISR